VPYAVDRSYSTADSWQAQGLAQAGPVLRAGRGQPSPFVRDVLQLPSGQSVMEVVRMRMAGDEPLAVETVYLATGRAPANLQDVVEDGTLYQALERATGLELTHAEVTVQAVILQGETARLLKVASGSPGLHLERRTYASTGEIVELAFTYVAGERQRLQLTVARAALMGV
jgi:GntR family transcriptional regulator